MISRQSSISAFSSYSAAIQFERNTIEIFGINIFPKALTERSLSGASILQSFDTNLASVLNLIGDILIAVAKLPLGFPVVPEE